MNIFQINSKTFQVEFAPQALLIKEFREIWDCDKSKDKFQATRELAYVYYMADDRSDYMYIIDPDERHDQVVSDMQLEGWSKPDYIDKAIEKYILLSETTSTKLLHSTRNVIQKISHFLNTIDPNERDSRTNKPVFDINKITASVEKVPKLVKALADVEREVIKEKSIKAQSGNKDIGLFDDGGI